MKKIRKSLTILLTVAMLMTMAPALVWGADDAGGRVNRIAGDNRYDTSAKIALDAYPGGAETVIIARGDNEGQFADGLAASYLAGLKDAPVLLTSPDKLPQKTEDAVVKLKAKKAYVLGGKLAISEAVVGKLKNLGLEMKRIEGNNRYATAASIAAEGGQADTALVVSGFAPADSLVAGPLASSRGYPILLVSKDSVPGETKQAIAGLGIKNINVVGGENVVGKAVYEKLDAEARYSGQSRIETSLAVAKNLFKEPKSFSIVGYLNLADAVGAAVYGNPIVYVKGNLSDVRNYLTGTIATDTRFTIFGGPLAVNRAVEEALQALPKPVSSIEIKPVTLTAEEQKLISLINQERQKAGVNLLNMDNRLVYLGRLKSQDMITYRYFDIDSVTYGTFPNMLKMANVSCKILAVNLAHSDTIENAHAHFMKTTSQRDLILDTRFTHVGVGAVHSDLGGILITEIFLL